MHVSSDTITLLHELNVNGTQLWLVGEVEDFQLADSSTATSTAIWDMVLSGIEWSKQITYAKTLTIYPIFFNWKIPNISPQILHANWISLDIRVTFLACTTHKLESSNKLTT